MKRPNIIDPTIPPARHAQRPQVPFDPFHREEGPPETESLVRGSQSASTGVTPVSLVPVSETEHLHVVFEMAIALLTTMPDEDFRVFLDYYNHCDGSLHLTYEGLLAARDALQTVCLTDTADRVKIAWVDPSSSLTTGE